MTVTTVCYLERDDKYLMLHRTKKKNDINEGKWIVPGGHCENGESPEDCVIREVKEETGYTLDTVSFRGIVTFFSEPDITDYMCLFTSDNFHGEQIECDEGELAWIDKDKVDGLELWEGDRIFLELIQKKDRPFFSLKLCYSGDRLMEAVLDSRLLYQVKGYPSAYDMSGRCPCCGSRIEGGKPGKYEICPVCKWENDPVQLSDPDFAGGANKLSLNESRKKFLCR